ncbi:MAG: hypothetical protein M1370_05360 [Bacteroidetes bacterium]|nr:hypothetical protein [Bacteroidota bacterium]MCL5026970.1 hypothetical protein [Chloroflexota bacterium]
MREKSIERPACRHLGLAGDHQVHTSAPTEHHRCYFWKEGVRIDLGLQDRYCLSAMHPECPWSSIGRDGQHHLEREFAVLLSLVGLVGALALNGALQAWRSVQWLLRTLETWAGVVLREVAMPAVKTALRWSWQALLSRLSGSTLFIERVVTRGARSALALGAGILARPKPAGQVAPGMDADIGLSMEVGVSMGPRESEWNAGDRFARETEIELHDKGVRLWRDFNAGDREGAAVLGLSGPPLEVEGVRTTDRSGTAGNPSCVPASALPALAGGGRSAGYAPSLEALLSQGIKALNEGKEDVARGFFVVATGLHPDCSESWRWKSRTAMDLPELIACLERALVIEPENEKARADLEWARQRYDGEQSRSGQRARLPGRVGGQARGHRMRAMVRAMWYAGGTASLLLGLLWIAAGFAFILAPRTVLAEYEVAGILPVLTLPDLPISSFDFYPLVYQLTGFLPDFNLLAVIPLLVGTTLLLVSDGLLSRQSGSVFWLLLAVAGAGAGLRLYSPAQESLVAVSALGAVAVLCTLLGWASARWWPEAEGTA